MNKLSDNEIYLLEKGNFNCKDLRKLYGDYFDGELTSSLRGRIDAHVDECERCKEFVTSYRMTVELARELGSSRRIPDGVQRRLRERLSKTLGINLSSW